MKLACDSQVSPWAATMQRPSGSSRGTCMRTPIDITCREVVLSVAACLCSCMSSRSEPPVIVPGATNSSATPRYEIEMAKLSCLSQQLQTCAVAYAHPRVHSKLTGPDGPRIHSPAHYQVTVSV